MQPLAKPSAPPTHPRRLQGTLGVASITFMVMAAAAPLTVVGGPMVLGFAFGNGAGLPMAYLVTAAVLLLFAAGFTAMTPKVASAGAFFAYVHIGLGRAAGIGTGYAALLTYLSLYVGVYALMGTAVNTLVTSFGGPSMPWWVWGALGLAVVSFLGYRNIELSGRVLSVLLVGEVGIVLILNAMVLGRGGGDEGLSSQLLDLSAIFSGAPGVALVFAVLSFIGVEATAVFRDEARNPRVTIPRATFLSLGVVGLFYAITSWVMVSAVGDSRIMETAAAAPEELLPSVSEEYLGRVGHDIIAVLFVTSLLAAAVTFHNVVARYLFALSSRSLLPVQLSSTHPVHGSPHRASTVTTLAAIALLAGSELMGLEPIAEWYTWTAGLASVGYVLLLLVTCLAVVVYFRRTPSADTGLLRSLIAPGIGLIGLGGILILMMLNLDFLVAGNTIVSVVIIVSLVAAYLLGPLVNRRRPAELTD